MSRASFRTYYVARRNAEDMDRRGPPGRAFTALMTVLVTVPATLFVLVMGGCAVYLLVSLTAWKLGIG